MNRIQNGHLPAHGDGSLSDADLVQAARRGDKRAFVEIVARHQAMVCGIALGILGDFAASEDAGQEAFLTAWRKIHELREAERLRAWLAQIARNAALGHLRRRRGHEPLDAAAFLPDESQPQPDAAAVTEEEAALVRESLAKLPELYRMPLVLYYRDGQSVRAVADALNLSEDAVKQRLARGREMLRERMSGAVETVLTKTGPTAVFTMTIAVAIGALATPAAIAGTVFSATAATTTATTGASTTSILSIMSTSKSFLVATALVAVLCVPVGYKIAAGKPSLTVQNRHPVMETNQPDSQEEMKPSFENSVLFAEWQQLHDTHGRTPEAMPALLKAINELKDPFRRRAFRTALVAEWVQLDPAGGLKFFSAKGADGGLRKLFFQEWLALDAPAAVDALTASGSGWEGLARESLPEIARRAPSRVADIVSRLPATESYWDNNVRDAFAILAESGVESVRKIAESLTGPNREQALAGVARTWAKSDLDGAVAWAKSLPNGVDRDEIVRVALMGRASVDPAAALDASNIVPPGGKYGYFATTTGARVLNEAAQANFDATMAWMAAHPGRFGNEDMMGLSHIVGERMNEDVTRFLTSRLQDGSFSSIVPAIENAMLNNAGGQRAAVWEWLKTQPENDATRTLKNYVLSSAGYQDPTLALRLATELPRTTEGDEQMQNLARSLFNGGNAIGRFDNLYAQSPERLREPLLQAAFSFLSAETIGDPQKWIGRLAQLSEANRARGIESVARAWAAQTPEEAVGWAGALAAGDTRTGAYAAIVSSWAVKDARGAADWVNSMSPGPERDRSAGSLSMAMATKYPREAWDWAMSINDSNQQIQAAAQAANTMARRNPATARQWIESSPFTPEIKNRLLSNLQSNGRVNP